MKTIGQTNEGNFLVEVSREEHTALKDLSLAAEGMTFGVGDLRRMGLDKDLSKTFQVVEAFAETMFRVNELRETINDLERILNKE